MARIGLGVTTERLPGDFAQIARVELSAVAWAAAEIAPFPLTSVSVGALGYSRRGANNDLTVQEERAAGA
jgi:hypothetical protein